MPKLKTLNDLKSKSSGKWQLDARHRLTYSSGEDKEQIELEASLIEAEADALVVSVVQKKDKNKTVTSIARINGIWQANESNQLEFQAEGQKDKLSFTGSWKVNDNNEIVYSYRTRSRNSKTSQIQTLTFKGYWDFTEKNRLTYLIEGDTESAFRFKGALQTPSILAKKGEIRYLLGEKRQVSPEAVPTQKMSALLGEKRQVSPEAVPTQKMSAQIGVEAKGKQQKLKTITLFGKWRLGQERQVPAEAGPMQRALVKATSGLELSFEMEYSDGEKREIRFGAEYNLTDNFSVAAQLIQKSGDPLGVEVLFTKEFLKQNASLFVRLKKTLRENAVEMGVSIPW